MNYDKQAGGGSDRCAAEAVAQHQRFTITEIIMWLYFSKQHAVPAEEGTFPWDAVRNIFLCLC